MDSRGFTLIELMVGLLAATTLLFGIGSLYVFTQRVGDQAESQTFLQRQGSIVLEQMAQEIRTATLLTRGACNADANSLQVTNSSAQSPFCFYRTGTQLFKQTNAGTWNLLSGTAATLQVATFTTTPAAPTTTVTITVELTDDRTNRMRFTTDLTRRN